MHVANIHEAKTHLSRLVERAAEGEEIIIAKAGKPMARLVPYREPAGPRKPGYWKGKVRLASDFDKLPEDAPQRSVASGREGPVGQSRVALVAGR